MSLSHSVRYAIPSTTPAANTTIGSWLCDGFRTVTVELFPASTPNFVIKFVKSNQDSPPDFATASSGTNQWSYCEVVDLNDGSAIDGSTGVTLNATTTRTFEWNNNASKWVGIVCTSYTSGTVTGGVLISQNN